MPTREELITNLTKKSDLRADWRNRVILDTLQEFEEPCTIKELLDAISEKYPTQDEPLFNYSALHHIITTSLKNSGTILNNEVTKKIRINPEYITSEVRFLPVSNYCVALLALSGGAFVFSLVSGYGILYTGMSIIVGILYILAQFLGSEFKIGGFSKKAYKARKPENHKA